MPEKPARLQVDPETILDDDKPPQTGHTFNIWFLKWAGGDSSTQNFVKLKFRVSIKRDSGYTKAGEKSPLCLFFARGCCYRGKKCPYLHRLPKDSDFGIPTQDCFGRDKTGDYRDDMSGVGLLGRSNRTLFVSGIHMNDQIEETLTRHFSEFGSIENIKVLYGKSCAFVTFRLEAEAQFTKEAMQAQALEGSEVLNIKWANEDPNPNAQQLTKRHMEELAMETVKSLLKEKRRRVRTERTERKVESKVEPKMEPVTPEDGDSTPLSGLLDSSRLAALRRIKPKQPRPEAEPQPRPFLAGYSSSEEE